MEERPEIRVSDAERQAAADRLSDAVSEGRLDLLEYDDRLARAYAAVTSADLARLFDDLPVLEPRSAPRQLDSAALRAALERMPTVLRVLWLNWFLVVAVNLTVWTLVAVTRGDADYFWPVWLLVPGVLLSGATAAVSAARRRSLPAS